MSNQYESKTTELNAEIKSTEEKKEKDTCEKIVRENNGTNKEFSQLELNKTSEYNKKSKKKIGCLGCLGCLGFLLIIWLGLVFLTVLQSAVKNSTNTTVHNKENSDNDDNQENERIEKYFMELEERRESILEKLDITTDEVENRTWYKSKLSPDSMNTSGVYMYFSVQDEKVSSLRIRCQYNGEDWIFFDKFIVNIDGEKVDEFTVKKYDKHTDVLFGNGVYEDYDSVIDNSLMPIIIDSIQADKVIIRFEGKYKYDHELTTDEKSAFKEVIEAYQLLSGEFIFNFDEESKLTLFDEVEKIELTDELLNDLKSRMEEDIKERRGDSKEISEIEYDIEFFRGNQFLTIIVDYSVIKKGEKIELSEEYAYDIEEDSLELIWWED